MELTAVFQTPTVYPEYDQLVGGFDDGTVGFRVALVPARGDNSQLGRFDYLKNMIEDQLGLDGEDVYVDGSDSDEDYRQYVWLEGGVRMEIDLYYPRGNFTSRFHQALSEYSVIFYNGHSRYGTTSLLNNEDAYDPDRYQIVVMHSCRSYEYYARQVFRSKATDEDPRGWTTADMIASGESTYAHNARRILKPLLEGLMEGAVAEHEGHDGDAPSWQSITDEMNRAAPGFLYGAAGARENTWRPED